MIQAKDMVELLAVRQRMARVWLEGVQDKKLGKTVVELIFDIFLQVRQIFSNIYFSFQSKGTQEEWSKNGEDDGDISGWQRSFHHEELSELFCQVRQDLQKDGYQFI